MVGLADTVGESDDVSSRRCTVQAGDVPTIDVRTKILVEFDLEYFN
jgi:hypothetical protein